MTEVDHRRGEMSSAAGDVIAGRYRLLDPLGEGGMATVYSAEDLSSGRRVAVKLLRSEIGRNPEAVERLRREAEILAHLRHPAIVAVESAGNLSDGRFFLCMELLEGETLGDRMRRGRMEVKELAPIVAGAAAGLAAAHRQGVIHRDLKPDNIYLTQPPFGGAMQVKLLDFGISKVVGFDKITRTGQVLGTPRYMAPEQLMAERELDPRLDVYALGIILYEALAGQPPFTASDPTSMILAILHAKTVPLRSIRPDVSPDVEALIARAMARSPEARYGSAADLATAFLDLPDCVEERRGGRAGMSTNLFGGMGSVAAVAPPPASGAEPFKPGTFSEFEAPVPTRGQVVAHPRRARGVGRSPGGSAAPTRPRAALGGSTTTPEGARSTAAPGPRAPLGIRGALLIGLLGGALVTVLAGGALLWFAGGDFAGASSPRPPAPVPTWPVDATPLGLEPADRLPADRLPEAAPVPDVVVGVRRPSDVSGAGLPLPGPAQGEPVPTSPSVMERAPAEALARPQSAPASVPTGPAAAVPAAAAPAAVPAAAAPAAAAAADRPVGDAVTSDREAAQVQDARRVRRERAEAARARATERTTSRNRPRETEAHGGGGVDAVPPPFVYEAEPDPRESRQETSSDLLRAARDELSRGNGRACVDLAARAIQLGGGPTAQLLSGDCHLRLGDVENAGKAYERFCRASPGHPAVDRVRAVVEQSGGRCH